MSELISSLNTQQKAAVLHTEGPLAVIAGAGSGKTRMLTHKIAYLINEIKASPSKILAVTFTNKAANEMKERVIELIGKNGEDAQISTYHSFAVRILREEIEVLGYPSNFNILDDIDQKMILKPIYKTLNLSSKTMSPRIVLENISKFKMNGTSPEEALEQAKSDTDKALAKMYKGYMKQKEQIRSLDFDDLLLFVHKIFNEHPEIAQKWGSKFDYILIDEFQDTSFIQYGIIKSLNVNNITIVGDPDQTIYSWRWADVNLINKFKKYFKNAKVIKLEHNYRSTQNILGAANKLISQNKNRDSKVLRTTRGQGNALIYYHALSEDSEARWVVDKIIELKKEKSQLKDIAILYRANYLSQAIERALINEGINYSTFGGVKFYQRQEVKDVHAFLRVIYDGEELSFRRIINTPTRKMGLVAQTKLFDWASQYKGTTFDALVNNFKSVPLSKGQKEELATLINTIRKYRKALETNPIDRVIRCFLTDINYYKIWNSVLEPSRIENINELIKSIGTWVRNNPSKNLSDYFEEISLLIDTKEGVSKDYVSLMTVHSAKGLEFKNIFIIGFSDSIFPSKRAIEENGNVALEEERRLAYVAITRAKDSLFISDARGWSIDYKYQNVPSRFIKEMGINIEKFTKEFIKAHAKDNYVQNANYVIGDKVRHMKFGEGIVVNIDGNLIDITFNKRTGTKTFLKNHKSIERIC